VPGVEAVALIEAVLNALSQRVTGPRAGSDCGSTRMIYSVFLLFALNIGWTRQEPIQTGRSQFDAGNYAGAVKTLTVAVANTPKDPAVHYWLARSYYEMRDYDNAIKHAETAVDLSPSNAEYYRWLGRAYGAKAEQSHSFFLARKVKRAFEAAVRLAPNSIQARRDLMQYCVQAPWIVGGDKKQAREQIERISHLDPRAGRLARAAYLTADKQWSAAAAEYLTVLDQRPAAIEPYVEAADFFMARKDSANIDRTLEAATRAGLRDPRLEFYRGVSLVLRNTHTPIAAQLLKSYLANVPERSDYPSHRSAEEWLRRIESK
jgi:tetratricopeptide (TPR) repeat protein